LVRQAVFFKILMYIYMYFPSIVDPKAFQVQTASQQPPFYFGGSNVPLALTLAKTRPTRSQIRLGKLVKRR